MCSVHYNVACTCPTCHVGLCIISKLIMIIMIQNDYANQRWRICKKNSYDKLRYLTSNSDNIIWLYNCLSFFFHSLYFLKLFYFFFFYFCLGRLTESITTTTPFYCREAHVELFNLSIAAKNNSLDIVIDGRKWDDKMICGQNDIQYVNIVAHFYVITLLSFVRKSYFLFP